MGTPLTVTPVKVAWVLLDAKKIYSNSASTIVLPPPSTTVSATVTESYRRNGHDS
jgi:hypothetical protein